MVLQEITPSFFTPFIPEYIDWAHFLPANR
jgi:hypothetical protein